MKFIYKHFSLYYERKSNGGYVEVKKEDIKEDIHFVVDCNIQVGYAKYDEIVMNFAFEKKFKIYYNDWKYIIFREDNNTSQYLLSIADIKTLPYDRFKKTFNNPYIHMNYVDDNLSFIDKL